MQTVLVLSGFKQGEKEVAKARHVRETVCPLARRDWQLRQLRWGRQIDRHCNNRDKEMQAGIPAFL